MLDTFGDLSSASLDWRRWYGGDSRSDGIGELVKPTLRLLDDGDLVLSERKRGESEEERR